MTHNLINLPRFALADPASPLQALAVEMAAHSAVPYQMATPTPEDALVGELRRFPGLFARHRGWTLLDRHPYPVPKAQLIGADPVTDIFHVLHGAARHSSAQVRAAAYATVIDMALTADRGGHRPALAEGEHLGAGPSGFWGLGFLIGHALSDPDPRTALAPLFDHPKPGTAPVSDSGWESQPGRYWAELITTLFRGVDSAWTFRETYPDIDDWWDCLTVSDGAEPGRISDRMSTTSPLDIPGRLHHHWQITTDLDDGQSRVLMRRDDRGCLVDQTIYHMQGTIAYPLGRSLLSSPDDAFNFYLAISETPIHAWQRWVFQQPYLYDQRESLKQARKVKYLSTPSPQEGVSKFWRDLIDWIDAGESHLGSVGEDYGYVLRNAPQYAARHALKEMRHPRGIALAFPALWFSRWVPDQLGWELVKTYLREADTEHHDHDDASSLRSGCVGTLADSNATQFNAAAARLTGRGGVDTDTQRVMLRYYSEAKQGISAGTAPSKNFSRLYLSPV